MSTNNDQVNDYFANVEDPGERDRLIKLDGFMTDAMGGIFPEMQFHGGERVFDAACGPGGWAIRLARAWPSVQSVGIDISNHMIAYANGYVEAGVRNASFLVGNIKGRLPFEDASFDAVNARFLETFMRPQDWHGFLAECHRILKPGGTIRLTESEATISPLSPNFEKMTFLFVKAMKCLGIGYSQHGMWNTAMLQPHLRDAGYEQIKYRATAIDSSYGTAYHESVYLSYYYGGKAVVPFYEEHGMLEPGDDVKETYRLALQEMRDPSFVGLGYALTCWGRKPMTV